MITHAEYHSNNPIPVPGVVFGPMTAPVNFEPRLNVIKIKIDMGIKKSPDTRKSDEERAASLAEKTKRQKIKLALQRLERFRKVMQGKGPVNSAYIARALHTSQASAHHSLTRLISEGAVVWTRGPIRKYEWIYD